MSIMTSFARHRKGLVVLGALLLVLLLLVLWSGSIGVQDAGDASGNAQPAAIADFGVGGMAVKVLGSVVLVLGILYLAMYAIRAFSGRAGSGALKRDAISVLHKRHIAPKKAIYVVKVGNRAMVVGVTDSQISHLADLSEEELESIRVADTDKGGKFKRHFLEVALGMKDRT